MIAIVIQNDLNAIFKRESSVKLKKIKISYLRLYLLAYVLYLTLFRTFFYNSIKTTKVVIDTEDLLKSASDILGSYRKACWLDGKKSTLYCRDN